jgi:hypothetical protein
MDWLMPLDDETLLRCQERVDQLIEQIDALVADIEATAERCLLVANKPRFDQATHAKVALMSERQHISIVPDDRFLGMWRIRWPDGSLSDRLNQQRAADAAYVARCGARTPRKPTEKPNRVQARSALADRGNCTATHATALQTPPVRRGVPR